MKKECLKCAFPDDHDVALCECSCHKVIKKRRKGKCIPYPPGHLDTSLCLIHNKNIKLFHQVLELHQKGTGNDQSRRNIKSH
jgi:hypothetical protein